MQTATGSRYFLYTEVELNGYPKRGVDKYGNSFPVSPAVQEYTYNCQLWDAENAELVWKGKGSEARATQDTLIFNDMLLPCAADNLTLRLARDTKDITNGKAATSIIDEINLQNTNNRIKAQAIFWPTFIAGIRRIRN